MNEPKRCPLIRMQVGLLIALLSAGPASAESAPTLLNFQGRLTSTAGAPVTTAQAIRVSVFQGGTATEAISSGTLVYQEDTTATPDANGVFTHVIGAGTPVAGQALTESDFNTNGLPLYVELKVATETLLPRTRMLSAAYAIEASRLDGKSANEIIGQAGGSAFANEVVRNGARIDWLSASQITVRPGTLGFSDGKVRKNAVAVTWDFANGVGIRGLDAGTEGASTWYYLYAVPDPIDDGKFSAVASVNAPMQVGGSGPAGYGVHRFLGSFRNSATSDIRKFSRVAERVYWSNSYDYWLYVSSTAQPYVNTWRTVDASSNVPTTGRGVMLNGYYDAWGSAAIKFRVAPETTVSGESVIFCADWQNGASTCDATIPVVNRSFIYVAELYGGWSNDANQATAFTYRGYEEDLSEF